MRRIYTNPLDLALHLDRGYKVAPYLGELAQSFVGVLYRSVRRIVNAPPRHGKSVLLCQYAVAWALLYKPRWQVILASNSLRTAQNHMRVVARILQALSPSLVERANMNEIRLKSGGRVVSAGIKSTLLGVGANLIVLDDPYRTAYDGFSEQVRQSVESWFYTTLLSRLHKGGSVYVVQQRICKDDLSGKLLESGENWEPYIYPAVNYDTGEVLFPELYSYDDLEKIRREMGDYYFQALYQQNPADGYGGYFAPNHFVDYDELGHIERYVMVIDTAYGDKKDKGDYTAWTVWGVSGRNLHLVDARRERIQYNELKPKIAEYIMAYHPELVIVESSNIGAALVSELQEVAKVLPIKPTRSKEERVRGILPFLERGFVKIPRIRDQNINAYLSEHYAFPNGSHDDFVDNTVMIVEHVRGSQGLWLPIKDRKLSLI